MLDHKLGLSDLKLQKLRKLRLSLFIVASPDPPFLDPNFTPYYSTVNCKILRIDLRCQKLQNSMNLMVILKYPICHWEYLKSTVKVAVYLDRAIFGS